MNEEPLNDIEMLDVMGIDARIVKLLEKPKLTEEKAMNLIDFIHKLEPRKQKAVIFRMMLYIHQASMRYQSGV